MSVVTLIESSTGELVFDGLRVTSRRRCPVCEHDSWCLVDPERQLAICPRTESNRKIGSAGWLHSLGGSIPSQKAQLRRQAVENTVEALAGGEAMQAQFASYTGHRIPMLAFELGVSLEALADLGVGWNGLWTFPMRNHRDEIVGFRTRTPEGRKYAIKGSRSGLFIPRSARRQGHVYVVEGASDVLAMIDMGLNAIGRPSCLGCEQEISRWTSGMEVTVIADADGPGIDGALRLTQTLRGPARRVEMALPPMKDVRECLNHGMTARDLTTSLRRYEDRRSSNGPRA